ncbi:nitroreductase, partial [Roridomyces roridus]
MSSAYLAALATRRTNYAISNKCSVPDEKLESIVKQAVMHSPTPFNIQSSRAVLVTGAAHTKLWDLISRSSVKGKDDEAKARTLEELTAFANGYGTVLIFEDQAVIDAICAKVPNYAKQFPVWSTNATGMLQVAIWTALTVEGLGASLQHNGAYSEELVQEILQAFNLPSTWTSTAIIPFGVPAGQPSEKKFLPIEDRVKIFKD